MKTLLSRLMRRAGGIAWRSAKSAGSSHTPWLSTLEDALAMIAEKIDVGVQACLLGRQNPAIVA